MSYLPNQTTGNTLWVDSINGDDLTAVSGRQDKPYLTIGAALNNTSTNDTVMVLPGDYEEIGLDVSNSVTLKSTGGANVTTIGDESATGIRVTVTRGSVLEGFTVKLPSDKGASAVHCAHSGTTNATLTDIIFIGTDGGEGTGLILDTTGNMVCTNVRFEDGDCCYVLDASQGILQVDGFHVVNKAGNIESCIKMHTGATGELNNIVIDGSGDNGVISNGIHAGPHQVTTLVTFVGGDFETGDSVTIGTTQVILDIPTGGGTKEDAAAAYVANFIANFELLSATDYGDGTVTVLVESEALVDVATYNTSGATSVTFPVTNIVEVKFTGGNDTYTDGDTITLAGNITELSSIAGDKDREEAAAAYVTDFGTPTTSVYAINAIADGRRVYVNLAGQGLIVFNDDGGLYTEPDSVTIGTNTTILAAGWPLSDPGTADVAAIAYSTAFIADDDVFTAVNNGDGTVTITLRTEALLLDATYTTANDATIGFLGTVADEAASGLYDPATGGTGVVDFINEYPQYCTVVASSINLTGIDNAITLSSNTVDVRIISGVLDATSANFKIDSGLTGEGGVFRAQVQMDPKFNIPTTWISSDHAWTFFTKDDPAQEASYQLWGVDQAIGHPEFGSGLSVGEGLSYSTKNTVFTTDGSTDAPGNNGTGFVDVSVAAESKESSTFTFQGLTTGHSILWCTNRKNASDSLKYWGIEMDQIKGAIHGSGSFIWEIQTAVSTWVEVNVQAVSNVEQYRYANNVFLRTNSNESIRVGIDTTSTWTKTTIDGTEGYWMRVRIIDGDLTTAPIFERMKLIPSHTEANLQGQLAAKGLAMWRETLLITGFGGQGGGGGIGEVVLSVGNILPGPVPAGAWQHRIQTAEIASGDYINMQFTLPGGICTAHDLTFKVIYAVDPAGVITNESAILSVLPVEVGGNLIADSSGSKIPTARTSPIAYDVNQAQVITNSTLTTAVIETVHQVEFGGFDISDYYEDDLILVRLENETSSDDLQIIALIVEGVSFTAGKRL